MVERDYLCFHPIAGRCESCCCRDIPVRTKLMGHLTQPAMDARPRWSFPPFVLRHFPLLPRFLNDHEKEHLLLLCDLSFNLA